MQPGLYFADILLGFKLPFGTHFVGILICFGYDFDTPLHAFCMSCVCHRYTKLSSLRCLPSGDRLLVKIERHTACNIDRHTVADLIDTRLRNRSTHGCGIDRHTVAALGRWYKAKEKEAEGEPDQERTINGHTAKHTNGTRSTKHQNRRAKSIGTRPQNASAHAAVNIGTRIGTWCKTIFFLICHPCV